MQAGIVLLGVPHPTYDHRDRWPKLTMLLRSCTGLNKRRLIQAEAESATIANVSMKSEQTGIEIPVISAFETEKTKIRRAWYRSQKTIVRKGPPIRLLFFNSADQRDSLLEWSWRRQHSKLKSSSQQALIMAASADLK